MHMFNISIILYLYPFMCFHAGIILYLYIVHEYIMGVDQPLSDQKTPKLSKCGHCEKMKTKLDVKYNICDACISNFRDSEDFWAYNCKICQDKFRSKYPWVNRYCVNCYFDYVIR